jgi:hypothetical protein
VVDVGLLEQLGAVAVSAIGNRRQMSIGFADTDHVVVAEIATVLIKIGRCMTESTGQEHAWSVADRAILGGWNMTHRRFTVCGIAVVAGIAALRRHFGIGVVECCTEEGLCRMAGTAFLGSQQVEIRFAVADDIVVTEGTAVLVQVGRVVVEASRRETARRMTGATILVRRQVSDIGLAGDADVVAVMAAVTAHLRDQGTGVINKSPAEPGSIVTGTAIARGRQMVVRLADTNDIVVAIGAQVLIQI